MNSLYVSTLVVQAKFEKRSRASLTTRRSSGSISMLDVIGALAAMKAFATFQNNDPSFFSVNTQVTGLHSTIQLGHIKWVRV
jgi:hypothetical protein